MKITHPASGRRALVLPLVLGSVLLLPGVAARAEPPAEASGPMAPNELTCRAERAVVFKDGYGMVLRRAVGTADERGEVFTEDVPDAAVLGAFWGVPDPGGPRLLGMDAGFVERTHVRTTTVPASGIAEVLAWNGEQPVQLELDDGTNRSGTVRAVLGQGQWLVLQTATGDLMLAIPQIRRMSVNGMKLEREQVASVTERKKRLTFRFEGAAGERALRLVYFRPGLRWIPTYRVELPPDETTAEARLALQAEILNEAEDLVDVPIDLVVGVPNFRFRETVSPFVLEPELLNALERAAPQLMGQAMSNAAFRSRAGERHGRDRGDAAEGGAIELPPELAAGGLQDLFVYTLPKTTLLREHRAAVPVFEAKVPLQHVYVWDLAIAREDLGAAVPAGGGAPLRLSGERVWHHVELSNGTEVPWTTGAALVLQGSRPLGQDLLTYTPRGGRTRLPVTVAVDVRAEYVEEETERTHSALQWNGYSYARIGAKGRMEVTNHKDVPIDLEITTRVGGLVDEVSAGGEVLRQPFRSEDWRNYRGDPAVNGSAQVTFRLRLAPGERADPWLAYHFFLRQ